MNECVMPAGDYYIGDLCYVMHEEWDEACALFFAGRTDHGCNEGKFTLKDGRQFVAFNTAYGDGTYRDQYGNFYHVDAGLIGAIKVADVREDIPPSGTSIVRMHSDFTCYSENGKLHFGRHVIDTDPEDEYEEEEAY